MAAGLDGYRLADADDDFQRSGVRCLVKNVIGIRNPVEWEARVITGDNLATRYPSRCTTEEVVFQDMEVEPQMVVALTFPWHRQPPESRASVALLGSPDRGRDKPALSQVNPNEVLGRCALAAGSRLDTDQSFWRVSAGSFRDD